jgi:predicted amidohydrolase
MIIPFPSFLVEIHEPPLDYSVVSLLKHDGVCAHCYHGKGSQSCKVGEQHFTNQLSMATILLQTAAPGNKQHFKSWQTALI